VQLLFNQSLPDLGGKPQALSTFRGKPLLVNFWATWCAPCVEEMPALSVLHDEIAQKSTQIIGIGIDSPSNIREFVSRVSVHYPLYIGGMGGSELARTFGNQAGGLPFTVLIGADGRVKKTYLGRLKMDQVRADIAEM
jgi:thiol-disulfide isomerase/thioredoxin